MTTFEYCFSFSLFYCLPYRSWFGATLKWKTAGTTTTTRRDMHLNNNIHIIINPRNTRSPTSIVSLKTQGNKIFLTAKNNPDSSQLFIRSSNRMMNLYCRNTPKNLFFHGLVRLRSLTKYSSNHFSPYFVHRGGRPVNWGLSWYVKSCKIWRVQNFPLGLNLSSSIF